MSQSKMLAEFEMQANVSMDDVVSAFVSQYEENLHARHKQLQSQISERREAITAIEKEVKDGVDTSKFVTSIPKFNLSVIVSDVNVVFDRDDDDYEHRKTGIHIETQILDSDNVGKNGKRKGYCDTIDRKEFIAIPKGTLNKRRKLLDEIEGLTDELSEVMVNLRDISRKERQVRGRIASMKLQESGAAELLKDKSLLQLVQL